MVREEVEGEGRVLVCFYWYVGITTYLIGALTSEAEDSDHDLALVECLAE